MKKILLVISMISVLFLYACNDTKGEDQQEMTAKTVEECGDCAASVECGGCDEMNENTVTNVSANKDSINNNQPVMTLVEIGSESCVPCRQMQVVLDAVEKKFGDQIKIVFHDIKKQEKKKYIKEYNIKLIPTQVFLDKDGKEIFRHEGFYPEEQITGFLKEHGLKVKS